MVRYFYTGTPLVIVATVFLLSMPWLGLIAFAIAALVALAALAAFAWAIVAGPYLLIRSLDRRWREDAAIRAPRVAPMGREGAGAL